MMKEKVFAEGQARLFGLSRQLSTCKAEIYTRERNIKMAAVSSAEIEALLAEKKKAGQDLTTHQSVGKLYVIPPVSQAVCLFVS
jgi:hypothetical protein